VPMMKSVLGLDVGSHTVKAVELRQTFRGLEPVQMRLHPRAEPDAPIDELLRRFVRMHQLSTEHVVSAIPSDRLSTRRMEFPFRDRKKLAHAVPFEVEGEIPFELERVLVGWEIVGGDRSHAVVAVSLAQKRDVSRLLGELREAACEPRILEAEGLVLGNLASLFELEGTRLLADVGHRKTTFCLLLEGRPIAARSIPVGGRHVTEGLAQDLGLSWEEAEQVKCEEGLFHAGGQPRSQRAVASLDRIAREIVRTLEAREAELGGSPEKHVASVDLCGGSARLLGLDAYLTERVGIPVARLAPPPRPEHAALVAGGDPALFAPALALALRSTAQARTRMNFRQDEFAYRTDLRRFLGRDLRPTIALAGTALVLGIAGVATAITLESRRAARLEEANQRLYAEAFPGQPAPANPLSAMRQAVDAAHDRADFLGVYGGNRSALDLLAELSRRVPPDLDVTFQELTIDRNVIRIKVASKSFEAAERLTAVLTREAPFESARVSSEIATNQRTGEKTFNVSIPLATPGQELS
jgi:general secretion pathway protein L